MKKTILMVLLGLSLISCEEKAQKHTVVIYQQQTTLVDTIKNRLDSINAQKIANDILIEQAKNSEKERIVFKKDSLKTAKEKEKEALIEKQKHTKYQKIMDKFGCDEDDAQTIFKHHVKMGFSKEMVVASFGRPTRINKSAHSFRDEIYSDEQWVYDNYGAYLYFDNHHIGLYSWSGLN